MILYNLGILFLFIANALDVFFTKRAIEAGIATEANPLMAWVIENYGFGILAFVKTLAVFAIWILLIMLKRKLGKIPKITATCFWGIVLIYGLVTVYHFFMQAMI